MSRFGEKIYLAHLGKAPCALDLGDGSERGEYVNQDYILNKLGRPHRAINLMYCYYPLDEGWPLRASVAFPAKDITNAWGYPYDDYFTYRGGLEGKKDDPVFEQMRDIRRHGQDVILTLTIDPRLSDDHLIAIAKDLLPFGRIMVRINHEATGNWFSFNKRASYKEVADFFTRFARIIHEYAPNARTILCAGTTGEDGESPEKIGMEELFLEAARETDIWSIDKYMSLHWGWPHDVAVKGGGNFSSNGAKPIYDTCRSTYERYKEITGQDKPMVMSEHNADGDVNGPYDQCLMLRRFCELVEGNKDTWLDGFTLYQFRDRGRLGLEWEDPNNPEVGIELPLLKEYKRILHSDWFKPPIELGSEASLPVRTRWGGSEDSDGIALPVQLEADPVYCELFFDEDDDSNLMIEFAGRWFYKSPGCRYIDLMPAFFENRLTGPKQLSLSIFCPPASGENAPGETNYFYELKKLPKIRIDYEPCIPFTI